MGGGGGGGRGMGVSLVLIGQACYLFVTRSKLIKCIHNI